MAARSAAPKAAPKAAAKKEDERPESAAEAKRRGAATKPGDGIVARLVKVAEDVGFIEKGQRNKQSGYAYRGIDDVLSALHEPLCRHGVLILPSVLECSMDTYLTSKGNVMQRCILKVRFDFVCSPSPTTTNQSDCMISCVAFGEASDSADKSVNKAHSSAYKNAIFQAFTIPSQEPKDSEAETPEAQARVAATKSKPKPKPKSDPPRDDEHPPPDDGDPADEHALNEAGEKCLSVSQLGLIKRASHARLKELHAEDSSNASTLTVRMILQDLLHDTDYKGTPLDTWATTIPASQLGGMVAVAANWRPRDDGEKFDEGEEQVQG